MLDGCECSVQIEVIGSGYEVVYFALWSRDFGEEWNSTALADVIIS